MRKLITARARKNKRTARMLANARKDHSIPLHFKALSKHNHSSGIADHVKTTGHNIKWDHFDIFASGKTDYHCKVNVTLFIQELQLTLNANVSSEKLLLY